jgi:glutamine---fructose-6-phosphate transaminase (isomerizing)
VEPVGPDVMIRQAERLAADLSDQVIPVSQFLDDLLTPAEWASADTVYLTGDGDSYHAACASAMAFETIADLACAPVSALSFLEYRAPWLRPADKHRPVVIAVSASGSTERAVQAIEAARHEEALTIAVTGVPGSAVTRAADRGLVIELPQMERSPGIRTYQASLLGLLLTAIRLGEARQRVRPGEADALRRELAGLADDIDVTAAAARDRCQEVADMISGAPVMVMTGSGPSYGTALYGAAKMIEAAGIFTAGQDLEEWAHVERWAYPEDMPFFVISPPGRSRWRAAGVAATARELGRRVIAVAPTDDSEIADHARALLPVSGQVREEFSVLLYHIFASYLASYLATRLGRLPFQADRTPRPKRRC